MKIGLVCPYSLEVPGGVQSHVLGLAASLGSRGHPVSVLAPGTPPGLPAYVVSAGRAIPVPYKGAVGRVSFGPVVAARVGRWLAEGDFDVVHVHEPVTPSVALLAARSAQAPVVATFHTAQQRPRALSASARALRPWLDRIDAHVAVSAEAASTVTRYLGIRPAVVPNGLHIASYAGPGSRAGDTILFLGRIDERRKGLDELLAAWPSIRVARPGTRLVVAGPGRIAERPPGVDVVGEVSEGRKRELLRRSDLLIAPNTHGESFGLVLTEAMAAGTPVLARDLPAFRDVLDDGRCGALFQTDLAGAAVALLDDPARLRALARRAASRVRRYDWSVVTPQVEEVYRSITDDSRAAAG